MPEMTRKRLLYSELQSVFRVGVLLRVDVPENSVAAAQWEVRGHMEDPAFQRKPSRPICILRGSRQMYNTREYSTVPGTPQARRPPHPKNPLTYGCKGC